MKMTQKGLMLTVGIITLLIAGGLVGVVWFYRGDSNTPVKYNNNSLNTNLAANYNTNTSIGFNANTLVNQNNTNSATIPPDKYGIFVQTKIDKINNLSYAVQYKDDGVIETGTYAGYHRVVAGVNLDMPMDKNYVLFATKDFKTFVVNSDQKSNYDSTDSYLNKEVVTSVGTIPTDFPETITQGDFTMVRKGPDFNAVLDPNLKIKSPIKGLQFYSNPLGEYSNLDSSQQAYLASKDDFFVSDASGVVYGYSFLSNEAYKRQTPSDPYKVSDHSFYKRSDFVSSKNLYEEYGELFPGQCGQGNTSYVLKDVSKADLTKVTSTLNGVTLYKFTDSNNAIYKDEYAKKITAWKVEFSEVNNGATIPSIENYVINNPVLVFQDPFDRWIGLGEWQYLTGGGCGKPVLYLYPPKPTRVTVKFVNPMRLTVDIPTYVDKWSVLANPDGTLKDLQPQKTNCNLLNTKIEGSEYAEQACHNNLYPYLYWAGQSYNVYPTAKTGWLVARTDLSSFLDAKLTEVGLNQKEKFDMISFWVPELLKKDSPYYRLSFFQTSTMNAFIPMEISPKPDTFFRIFLDWNPLASITGISIQPETLQHLDRKGFTVVEWGGVK